MKLTAYVINDQPVGTQLLSWQIDDLGGNAPFKVESTVSTGYQDISSITNWLRFGYRLVDYKVVRHNIIIIAATTGFSNLSQSEKEICATMFAVAKSDRDSLYSLEQQIIHGREYHTQSVLARKARRHAAESEAYNRIIDGNERADLMNGVKPLLDVYVEFGVEGTVEGDIIGLFDYLESRTGTAYENIGLLSKTYTIEGMTLSQFSAKLMDILKNGRY